MVKPSELRKAFRAIHSSAQRGKVLEDFAIFDNRYLLSIDGTGQHSSTKVKCPQCCVKKHRNGEIEYYHQSLAAVIVHPDQKTVLPLDFEPIVKSDGDKKNDCERNAAKRLLLAIHQLYANRPFIVLEDALAANGPHIQALMGYGMDFIINAKPVGNASLFEVMHERFLLGEVTEDEETLPDGRGRGYRFVADLPLNASHPDTRVNMIEYWEVDKNDPEKVTLNMSWITNLDITRENVYEIVRAARTRWKVGGVRGRARSYRFPASPPRTGHAPLSASGSPLRRGVPPWPHHLPMLPACAAFHRLSKVFTSLWSVNLSHQHTRAAPLRRVVGFPHLGLLRELRQSVWHRDRAPLASAVDLPRFTCSDSNVLVRLPVAPFILAFRESARGCWHDCDFGQQNPA